MTAVVSWQSPPPHFPDRGPGLPGHCSACPQRLLQARKGSRPPGPSANAIILGSDCGGRRGCNQSECRGPSPVAPRGCRTAGSPGCCAATSNVGTAGRGRGQSRPRSGSREKPGLSAWPPGLRGPARLAPLDVQLCAVTRDAFPRPAGVGAGASHGESWAHQQQGPRPRPPQRWRGHPAAARCPGRASPFVVGLDCRSPVKAARGAGAGSRARVIIQSREVTPRLRGPSASGREREHGFPTPDCVARCAPCLAPGPWAVVAAGLVIGTPRGSVRRDFRPRWSPPGTLLGPPRRPGDHTATTRPEPLGPAGRPLPTETPRPTATRPLPPAALSEAQWRLV